LAKLVGKPAPALTLKPSMESRLPFRPLWEATGLPEALATYCIPAAFKCLAWGRFLLAYGDQMTIIAAECRSGRRHRKVKQFAQDFDLHMPVTHRTMAAWLSGSAWKATPVHLVIGREWASDFLRATRTDRVGRRRNRETGIGEARRHRLGVATHQLRARSGYSAGPAT